MKEKGMGEKGTLSALEANYRDIEIENIADEYNLDNIPLIDYEMKEDAIFGDLDMDDESGEEVDITKIYENELDMSDDEIEKIKAFEDGLNTKNGINSTDKTTIHKHTMPELKTKLNIELNSDVGNDICMENIKKIHAYLDEDEKTERMLEEHIKKERERQKRDRMM